MAMNHLPPEILGEILLRLPIKTLTIARFVNKFWFGIISSSEFVKARLKNSTLSDHRVVFDLTDSGGLLLEQFSVDYRDSSLINLVDFGYPERSWLRSVGSCNGLICFFSKEMRLILLNPCTGKYNELPPLDLEPRVIIIFYGFGYDASTDDYKVVVAFPPEPDEIKIYVSSVVQVYSLKSNSWRRIQDFSSTGALFRGLGKFASGKIYWRTNCVTDSYNENKIVSFDLGTEVFGIFEQPVDSPFTRLDVLGGCICLLAEYGGSHADLWVRKEYGAWIKTVTVSYTLKKLRTCSLLPTGEILFLAKNKSFVVCDPNNRSFQFLDKPSWRHGYELPFIYVQSLVSPICTDQARGRKIAKLV